MAYDYQRHHQRQSPQDQGAQCPPTTSSRFSPRSPDAVEPSSRSALDSNGRFLRPRHQLSRKENPDPDTAQSAASVITCSQPSTAATWTSYDTFPSTSYNAYYHPRKHSTSDLIRPLDEEMTYYDGQQRPLIDLIPHQDLDVSDEEDAFYAVDEGDYLLHPKWRALITRNTNRIPRRIRRYSLVYVGVVIVFLISWWIYLGPQYTVYKQELSDMDNEPEASFGKNVRPEFKGMVQVKDMDSKLLPKGEGRLVVVGDVHGCKEELEELLKKVEFKEGRDHLALTGDIISKGPDSPGVVSLVSRLGASCVRGNHEDKVLLSIAEMSAYHDPTIPGPDEAPDRGPDFLDEQSFSHGDNAVRKLAKSFSHSQISWLQSCPVILRVGTIGDLSNVVVVHAGLVPDIPLKQQDPFQVMNMRTIDLKTRLPSEKRDGTPWEKFWNHQQKKKPAHERMTVIYGHDRKRGKNIQKYSMGLDSGCVGGGYLTAMVIEESGKHKYVQVKCKGYVD